MKVLTRSLGVPLVVSAVLGLGNVAVLALGTSPAGAGTAPFVTTITDEGESQYAVPLGTTSLTVTVVGAQGQNGWYAGTPGSGAEVQATIPVPATSTLYVEVGGTDGYSGGGGLAGSSDATNGGGASDIQTCSIFVEGCTYTADPSSDPRLVVAGGGGGGGANDWTNEPTGGAGGSAGTSSTAAVSGNGGAGVDSGYADPGGDAGRTSLAGSSGTGGAASALCAGEPYFGDGSIGLAGTGGAGGSNQFNPSDVAGGGGGGGGWVGGAGGGAGGSDAYGECYYDNGAGGGGGAGLSFVRSGASDVSVGAATGDPEVIIQANGPWSAPTVTSSPSSQTVLAGGTATFTAAASGNPTPTVQWQESTNAGSDWADVPGATSDTLSFTTNSDEDGYLYHAVFTNVIGSATSDPATLTVQYAPTVTTQPTSQTVTTGGTATFTAAASGNPTPTVQWQDSTDGGSTWSNIVDATSDTLSFAVDFSQNDYQYHAVYTNSVDSATTDSAVLTVGVAPAVTTDPTDLTVVAGDTATFTAAASGNPTPTVQWQYSTDGTNWNSMNSTSATLSFTASEGDNGKSYEAVFTNDTGTVTTAAAMLTVQWAPAMQTQPENKTVNDGQSVTFYAYAGGNPDPSAQWQDSTDGGTNWNDVAGATSAMLTFTAGSSENGYEYRAVFTNSVGAVTSDPATLTVVSVANVPDAPGTPAASSAIAKGKMTVTLTWTDNGDGGSAITDHEVNVFTYKAATKKGAATYTFLKTIDTGLTTSGATISGLKPGSYAFSVAAVNSVGASDFSGYSSVVGR
jgi:hypothetical protein